MSNNNNSSVNLINYLCSIENVKRWDKIFDYILQSFQLYDKTLSKNENYRFMVIEHTIHEFIDLILCAKGKFQISVPKIYLIDDPRFFIYIDDLECIGLKALLVILDKLTLTKEYEKTILFQTNPIFYKFTLEFKKNILFAYFRYILCQVSLFGSSKESTVYQFKLYICKMLCMALKYIELIYKVKLPQIKNMIVEKSVIFNNEFIETKKQK